MPWNREWIEITRRHLLKLSIFHSHLPEKLEFPFECRSRDPRSKLLFPAALPYEPYFLWSTLRRNHSVNKFSTWSTPPCHSPHGETQFPIIKFLLRQHLSPSTAPLFQGGFCPIPKPETETPSDILKAGGYTHLTARILWSWDTHQTAVCRGGGAKCLPRLSKCRHSPSHLTVITCVWCRPHFLACWTYSSTLKIEWTQFSETLVTFYHSTSRHILEYSTVSPR